jgi:hypothetical protein
MKSFSYVLAALTTIVIVSPAIAEDKPMMKNEGMGMHHSMRHHHKMMGHKMGRMHESSMMKKKDAM